MVFGTYTTLDAILEKIAARIVARSNSILSSDRVFETLAPDDEHLAYPPGDQFATITPQRFASDQALAAGQGRYTMGFDGQIRVAAIARFAGDQELRNARLLRDATRGLLNLGLRILDALHMFEPTNSAGDCILKEPMRVTTWDVQPKRMKDANGSNWCVIASLWDVRFITNLPSGNS